MQGEEEQPANWQFNPKDESSAPQPVQNKGRSTQPVTWTASEFLAHPKNISWFIALGLVTAVLCIGVYTLTRDKITTGMLIIISLAFGALATRQPRVLKYMIDDQGISVGDKFYPYGLFKSFSIMEEGAVNSIYLMPLKRFMPALTMYYPPNEEQKVMNVLDKYLPREFRKHDPIDRLMSKIHF